MDGIATASAEEAKNGEICMVFHELLCMAKHMVDEILPDVLLHLDKTTIESIIALCEDFDGSMLVFKKLCGVIAKKNLCLQGQQIVGKHGVSPGIGNSTAGTNSSTAERKLYDEASQHKGKKKPDTAEITQPSTVKSVESRDGDDNIWKDLFHRVKEVFDDNKKCSPFYYCGLCNIRCFDTRTWSSHELGKKHSQRCTEVPSIRMHCDTCGFHMISDHQHIAMVFNSSLHHLHDEAVTLESLASETSTAGSESSNDATSVVNPHVESNKITTTGEVYFHGTLIVSHFVTLTAQLVDSLERRERFTVCCCMACNYLAEQKNQWLKHLENPKHESRMNSKHVKNVVCACLQCDFGMIAYDLVAPLYMRYHIEQCHFQCTDNIRLDEYMNITEVRKPLGSSRPGSFKGSTESMQSQVSRRSSFADEASSRPTSRNEQPHSKNTSLSGKEDYDAQHSRRSTPFSGRSSPSRLTSANTDQENGKTTQPRHPSRSSSAMSHEGNQETMSSPNVKGSYGNTRTGSAADGNYKNSNSTNKSPDDKILGEKFNEQSPPQASSECMILELEPTFFYKVLSFCAKHLNKFLSTSKFEVSSSTLKFWTFGEMDGIATASAEEAKNGEICMVFHELLCMAKHMVDEILPDVLLLLDKTTIESIIALLEDFDSSMLVFKKLCGVVAKKNLCLQGQQIVAKHGVSPGIGNSTAGTNSSAAERKLYDEASQRKDKKKPDTAEITQPSTVKSVESRDGDDNIWKDLFHRVKEVFDDNKKCSPFYYCGLCNIRCFDTHIWSSHELGKNHSRRCTEVPSIRMRCDTCGFHMISDHQHIAMVFNSSLHHLHDEAVTLESLASETSTAGLESCNDATSVVNPHVKSTKITTTGEVYFHGTLIVSHFVTLTAQLVDRLERRERFTVCCCIACDYLAEQKNQWLIHLKSPKHESRMRSKHVKNIVCACLQCDFGMIAYDLVAPLYMRYHNEQCHFQCTDNIHLDEYMNINEVRKPLGSSRPGSFKGSSESMQSRVSRRSSFADEASSRPTSRNEQPHSKNTSLSGKEDYDAQHSRRSTPFSGRSTPSRLTSANPDRENGRTTQPRHPSRSSSAMSHEGNQETVCSPDVKGSYGNTRTGSAAEGNYKNSNSTNKSPDDKILGEKFNELSPPQASSDCMVSDDDNFLGPFIHLLHTKEKMFQSNSCSKPFSALCLFCPDLNFTDAFQWYDHVLSHTCGSLYNEVQCSSCNTYLYGDISQISSILIPHPMHVRIDRLMRS